MSEFSREEETEGQAPGPPEEGCWGSLGPPGGRSPRWAQPAGPTGMICRIGASVEALQIPELRA